jgi:hypothetical protein
MDDLLAKDIPPVGWAKAQICLDTLNSINQTDEHARYVVKIQANSDVHFAYHTDIFVCEKWDESYPVPPPIPTDLEREIRNDLVDQLHKDGWLDTLTGNAQPTFWQYWRRTD